ncbi:MAG: LCP family protein, partial [Dermatophilaceae bacterium]
SANPHEHAQVASTVVGMAGNVEVVDVRTPLPARGGRRSRRLVGAMLAVLALLAVTAAGYAVYLHQLVSNNVVHQDLLPGGAVPTDAEAARADAASLGPDHPASSLPVKLADTGLNVLVIGSDKEVAGEGWSDVIFLVHVTQKRDHVVLTRLPRDLYVTVPGHGPDQLRTAYTIGGATLLVEAVQDLLGIVVDHVAVTGFAGFRGMTDAVGGVDVLVTEPGEWPGYTFVPGTMHMDGQTALAFVRERTGGDLSRGTRQQAFLSALMAKSLSAGGLANPVRLAGFLDAATENLTVDRAFTVDEMRSVAFDLRGTRAGGVSFFQAPVAGSSTTPAQESVLLVDVPKMRALGDAQRTDRLVEQSD